jgi:hypothetical protein
MRNWCPAPMRTRVVLLGAGFEGLELTTILSDAFGDAIDGDSPPGYCSFAYSALASFRRGSPSSAQKANPPQQALETLVVAQDVHARIYMKIDKPVGMLLIAFLQVSRRGNALFSGTFYFAALVQT